MPWETTYTKARANLASICQEVIDSRDFALINRPGEESVALIAASELESLLETAHLLRSPKNAERLMTALNRARRHDV
ncbi:MAG: antitoxin YefM [Candidatus Latescibacterota bacterium]|jgi:antitoxin YefM